MKTIQSTQHKEIVGSVNDVPYTVSFDADGFAEVGDAVADQLLSGNYGVVLIDEDGAEVKTAEDTQTETTQTSSRRRRSLDGESGAE